MNAPRSIRERLRERFRDKRYRRVYVEDFLNTSIAAQIQALRKARKLSQKDLAAKIGTKQHGISRLEDVNYTGWRVGTLKKLARAFDVVLVVRFESFGDALNDIANFSKRALLIPSFEDDSAFAPEGPQRITRTASAAVPPWPVYLPPDSVAASITMARNRPVFVAVPRDMPGPRQPWSNIPVIADTAGGRICS